MLVLYLSQSQQAELVSDEVPGGPCLYVLPPTGGEDQWYEQLHDLDQSRYCITEMMWDIGSGADWIPGCDSWSVMSRSWVTSGTGEQTLHIGQPGSHPCWSLLLLFHSIHLFLCFWGMIRVSFYDYYTRSWYHSSSLLRLISKKYNQNNISYHKMA